MTGTLGIFDVAIGSGALAEAGSRVTVHSVGRLETGETFEDSRFDGRPHQFRIGDGEVIEGWEKGIVGMRVGGKRGLTVPPSFAYGDRGVLGRVPPNATLAFEVELVAIDAPDGVKPAATEWFSTRES